MYILACDHMLSCSFSSCFIWRSSVSHRHRDKKIDFTSKIKGTFLFFLPNPPQTWHLVTCGEKLAYNLHCWINLINNHPFLFMHKPEEIFLVISFPIQEWVSEPGPAWEIDLVMIAVLWQSKHQAWKATYQSKLRAKPSPPHYHLQTPTYMPCLQWCWWSGFLDAEPETGILV